MPLTRQLPPRPANTDDVDPLLLSAIDDRIHTVEQNLDDPEAWGQLGILYSANGYAPLALDCYRIAYLKDPSRPRWRFHWALNKMGSSDYAETEKAFLDVLALIPDHASTYEQLGKLALERGDYSKAEKFYKKVIALRPDEAPPYAGLAQVYLARGQHEQALTLLNQAINLAPRWGMPHFLRGRVYQALGRTDEVAAELRKGADSSPSRIKNPWLAEIIASVVSERSIVIQAKQRIDAGLMLSGIIMLEKLLKTVPHDKVAISLLTKAYLSTNRPADALRVLDQALEKHDQHPTLYLQRSIAHLHLKHFQLALADAEVALEIAPQDARAYLHKGDALLALKRIEEALEAYTRCRELDPSTQEVHKAIGRCFLHLKRYQEAITPYERAVELESENYRPIFALGMAYAETGRLDEAVKLFRKAQALRPGHQLIQKALERAQSILNDQ